MGYGQIFNQRGSDGCFINVNVGGFKQRMECTVLKRFPQTRLGRLLCCHSKEAILELCDDFSPVDMEYYFDRNPHFFCYILNFYLTGKMHFIEGLCVVSFCQEIEYWGIKERYMEICCSNKFYELMQRAEQKFYDQQSNDIQLNSLNSSLEDVSVSAQSFDGFEGSWCANIRKYLWIRLENPGYSTSAKAIAIVSLALIIVSIVAMCVNSMSDVRQVDDNGKEPGNPSVTFFENLCVLYFSAEFVLRLAVAPSKRKFLCDALNIIDFMSVMPFYVTVVCDMMDGGESKDLEKVGKVVQIFKLMRVFRILKLARHSTGLRSLGATLLHSSSEVGQLVLFLSVGISFFSTLTYFAEREARESELQTIPICWWWATISMTTVGYGDTLPVTPVGKIIGTLCIIVGLLIVALPITNIFNKFSKFYYQHKQKEFRQRTRAQRTQD